MAEVIPSENPLTSRENKPTADNKSFENDFIHYNSLVIEDYSEESQGTGGGNLP